MCLTAGRGIAVAFARAESEKEASCVCVAVAKFTCIKRPDALLDAALEINTHLICAVRIRSSELAFAVALFGPIAGAATPTRDVAARGSLAPVSCFNSVSSRASRGGRQLDIIASYQPEPTSEPL